MQTGKQAAAQRWIMAALALAKRGSIVPVLAMVVSVLLLVGFGVAQQTTDPNQALIDEKARLQLQKDIEDLKMGINQDRIDQIKASIGSISTTGLPTGAATLNNVDIQPT